MDNNKKDKKRILNLGILAFAPLVLFAFWLLYYFIILGDYIVEQRLEEHLEIAGTTVEYYTPLFLLLGTNFVVAFIAFLYFVLNIWTRPDVPSGNKIVWVIFLATFNLVAFPVFWYMHIKNDYVRTANASPALS
ncbi:MAG TPA: EamA family transporter [Flavipsychrobacter sp.]|nr:EamA family transporter [Flavipsychrobacter sp.]